MTEDLAEATELCPDLLLLCNPDAQSSVRATPAHLLYVKQSCLTHAVRLIISVQRMAVCLSREAHLA